MEVRETYSAALEPILTQPCDNLCSDKGSRANFVRMLPLCFKTNFAPFVVKWNQIRLEVLMGEFIFILMEVNPRH